MCNNQKTKKMRQVVYVYAWLIEYCFQSHVCLCGCSLALSSPRYLYLSWLFVNFAFRRIFVCHLFCIYTIIVLAWYISTTQGSSIASSMSTTTITLQFEFFSFVFLENNYGYYNFYLLFEVQLSDCFAQMSLISQQIPILFTSHLRFKRWRHFKFNIFKYQNLLKK